MHADGHSRKDVVTHFRWVWSSKVKYGKISKRCSETDKFSGAEKVDWKIVNFLTSLEDMVEFAPGCANFDEIHREALQISGVDNSLEDRFAYCKLLRRILDVFSIFILFTVNGA